MTRPTDNERVLFKLCCMLGTKHIQSISQMVDIISKHNSRYHKAGFYPRWRIRKSIEQLIGEGHFKCVCAIAAPPDIKYSTIGGTTIMYYQITTKDDRMQTALTNI